MAHIQRKNRMIFSFIMTLMLISSISMKAQSLEGSLVKGSKDPVYIIENGKALWISSDKIFNLLGFDWKSVKTIPDSKLKNFPRGWLIVRGSGSPIYILNYGTAIKVSDWNTLMNLGFEKTNIRQVQEEKLKMIPQQPLLVKGSGAPIYLIINGKAAWIQSENILKALGYEASAVIQTKDAALNSFPKTQLLVTGRDNKIYLVDKDRRYWISSAQLFNRLGYDWDAVMEVSEQQLRRIPEGSPIK